MRSVEGDHFGWHPSTGPDVDERDGHIFVNNLLTGDKGFERPLLFTWQSTAVCDQLTKPLLQQLDHNVYVRGTDKTPYPLLLWSPASSENCQAGFESLDALRKAYPEFSANSRNYLNYAGPLFKSMELGHYQLLPGFPGLKSGTQLPEKVSKILDQSE